MGCLSSEVTAVIECTNEKIDSDVIVRSCTEMLEVETDPGLRAFAYFRRGVAHSSLGENDKAVADLDMAILTEPSEGTRDMYKMFRASIAEQ